MDITCRYIDLCACSCRLFGECAIRRKVSCRRVVGWHRWNAKRVDRLPFAGGADRGGQLSMAHRQFDRERLIRRRYRRPEARSVLPPYRPCPELLRGPIARYAREPRHGDIQCRLYGGEYVYLEHIAAMRRNRRGDRLRWSHQRADIGHAGG